LTTRPESELYIQCTCKHNYNIKLISIFREEATTALIVKFHAGTIQVELEFANVVLSGGRKTGEPWEKPLEQGEDQ